MSHTSSETRGLSRARPSDFQSTPRPKRPRVAAIGVLLVLAWSSVLSAREIKQVRVELGYNEHNTLRAKLLDGTAIDSVFVAPIESNFDQNAEIVRRLSTGAFTRGVKYELSPAVDLAALLTETLRSEMEKMGLVVAERPGDGVTTLEASLDDIYLETKQVPYGPVLFYGHLQMTVSIDGEKDPYTVGAHNLYQRYNAGFGRRDEAEEALARFLIDTAHEAGAIINRRSLSAPPLVDVEAKVGALGKNKLEDQEILLREVAIAGNAQAVKPLLGLLETLKHEHDRAVVINTLAILGSDTAVEPLLARFDGEDEDCRLYILRALAEIDPAQATQLARSKGIDDKDKAVRSLSQWLLDRY